LCTAVYRALAEDGRQYFCKLRCSDFKEFSVELPKFLSQQGIAQVIPPLTTQTGALWAGLEGYNLILYPFVDGISGFEVELTEAQWQAFGSALQRIHTLDLPDWLQQKIPSESYDAESRDICREVLQRIDHETFADPVMRDLAAFVLPRRETIVDLLEHAERLARTLAERPPHWVLCHSDIHPGNLFIDKQGSLFIVDWDSPVLAPKERDLMFVGGGQGYVGVSAEQEEQHFYRYYGAAPVDPLAMAYYRCERNLYDLSVECPRILSSTLNDQDRAMSLQYVTWLFLPGASIDQAYRSLDI
jgi:spectinomycin phosphotransferase